MRLHLIIFLMFLTALVAIAAGVKAQNVTLEAKATPLYQIFKQIEKQTGYRFWYSGKMLGKNTPITASITNLPLKAALDKIFTDIPFTYEIVEETIVVKEKSATPEKNKDKQNKQTISGIVIDENGEPLVGASVTIKGTGQTTMTNSEGKYTFLHVADDAVLIVTYVGYTPQQVNLKNAPKIALQRSDSKLDDVQVIAYGTTTKRLNTGSVVSVSAKDIERQPVSNPLATLIGRVPGLIVTQQSGVPGSSFNIQIRGRNSIAQGSQPLILIDGIPFAAGNENIGLISSAISVGNQNSGVSPFNSISPSDIESIEVLKDADATAIYGSRGANGVILVTTKKGKAGKTQITANVNKGFTKVGTKLDLLNTEQYLEMRREAFKNAGTAPTNTTAPDLLVWDTNRYTDYQKDFLGGTGKTTNANLSLSGGNATTQFLLSGTYYNETSIFPGKLPNKRGSALVNISHRSADERLNINFSGNFTSSINQAPSSDLSRYAYLPPNTPAFFDDNGNLKWTEGGISYDNPYAFMKEEYSMRTSNLSSSINISYKIVNGLSAKALLGYNQQFTNEQLLSPAEAKRPTALILGPTAIFGRNQYGSWNVEPQIEYVAKIWKGKLTALIGTTFHVKDNNTLSVSGSGYSSNALLEAFDAATIIDASSVKSKYKYNAIFGRINYNIGDKYLLNLTARRDGSSRFGPGKQFSNFGAIGTAWIFSSERWMRNFPILSFGKLRTSYGVTGNDQIGDYQFVETWSPPFTTYQGSSALVPNNLFNAGYAWERNNKLEAALDLGFFKERLLISVNYFQNRSGNQLVNYRLPYITGFGSILANFPAKVQNKGWELMVSGSPVQAGKFKWESSFNITLPSNKLLEFPGIESSSYSTYKVGQSLDILNKYVSLGVDPQTGLIKLLDANASNTITSADFNVINKTDPKFYGGWQNTFSYLGFELQCFFDFKKQFGKNEMWWFYNLSTPPGTITNQPDLVLRRWKNPGDVTDIPKFMPTGTGTAVSNVLASSYTYADQSFIRLRNLSFAYNLPNIFLSKIKVKTARVYVLGQNLMTFNRLKGLDPETQNPFVLPALTSCTVGLQITY